MRIIAGSLKGRQFESPHNRRTHPMSDRVRGALFNALGDLTGLNVLDAYGGTGALAFEAISRGAKSIQVCEIDVQAQKIIEANIEKLQLENITLHRGNAKSWLKRHQDTYFNVVLLDPPYDDIDRVVLQLAMKQTVPGGIIALSWPGKAETFEFAGTTPVQVNSYGDAQLLFLRAG
jgi:16S rRNA (guanine966-N2)-methyltransferase